MQKTLAMKLLEGRRIPYEAVTYPESERDAAVIAGYFGVPAAQVFKTLVVARPPAKPILVMLGADSQLDLKKLAKEMGEKKLKMASHQEAEELTGLQVGGISALALVNRGFIILLDRSAQQFPEIYISSGQRGINLKLPVAALVKITGARYVDIGDRSGESSDGSS